MIGLINNSISSIVKEHYRSTTQISVPNNQRLLKECFKIFGAYRKESTNSCPKSICEEYTNAETGARQLRYE